MGGVCTGVLLEEIAMFNIVVTLQECTAASRVSREYVYNFCFTFTIIMGFLLIILYIGSLFECLDLEL